jgi:L-threonylcarbamoyladenylate synthase
VRGSCAIETRWLYPVPLGDILSAEMLRVHPDEPEPELIKYIVACLESGKVVGMPTDTFYGLAVDPVNLGAVKTIYSIKSRLKHKPLSLLISSVAQAYQLARDTDASWRSASGRGR